METSKKECILVEAAKAFARFGFRKASIDEIAKEAGVGKGTVYLAAESKEDLYYQVLHREIRAWQAQEIHEASGASDKTYLELKGATHYLQGRRREAMDLVVDWLRTRVP